MNQDDLLGRLHRLGLGRYESAVYLGLLFDPDAKVTTLSKHVSVPAPKVYQALEALVDKGFCILAPDAVNRYRAVPPKLAFTTYLDRLRESEQSASILAEELTVIQRDHVGRKVWAPHFEVIKGQKQVAAILLEQVEAACSELRFMSCGPSLLGGTLREEVHRARERQVAVRSICEQAQIDEPGVREELTQYCRDGVELRVAAGVPTKMMIADRQVALVAITKATGVDFLVLRVLHVGLLAHFLASFDSSWNEAEPFANAPGEARGDRKEGGASAC